jgi:transcription elongation factor Elf1
MDMERQERMRKALKRMPCPGCHAMKLVLVPGRVNYKRKIGVPRRNVACRGCGCWMRMEWEEIVRKPSGRGLSERSRTRPHVLPGKGGLVCPTCGGVKIVPFFTERMELWGMCTSCGTKGPKLRFGGRRRR